MLEASFPLALTSLVRNFIGASLPTFARGTSLLPGPINTIRSFFSLVKARLSKDVGRITQVLLVMSRYDNSFDITLKDGNLAVQNPAREDRDYLEHVKLLTRAATSVGGIMLIPGSQCGRPRFIFHPTG